MHIAPGPYHADSPILGRPYTTLDQARSYFQAHGTRIYTLHDVCNVIVPAYWRVCESVDVDPVLTLAQMAHETGHLSSWWCQRPRRNPAGIGVTGRTRLTEPGSGTWVPRNSVWAEGVSFHSWVDEAIPAHIGRLLAYTMRDDQATSAQHALIKRALVYRSLPATFRGIAPTLRGLNGRWAVPGMIYADNIAKIANVLCAYKKGDAGQ
jgi:hypothetical protein